jgi:hypothetical protein
LQHNLLLSLFELKYIKLNRYNCLKNWKLSCLLRGKVIKENSFSMYIFLFLKKLEIKEWIKFEGCIQGVTRNNSKCVTLCTSYNISQINSLLQLSATYPVYSARSFFINILEKSRPHRNAHDVNHYYKPLKWTILSCTRNITLLLWNSLIRFIFLYNRKNKRVTSN